MESVEQHHSKIDSVGKKKKIIHVMMISLCDLVNQSKKEKPTTKTSNYISNSRNRKDERNLQKAQIKCLVIKICRLRERKP